MNNLGKYLVEELIKEIENITEYVVVYSGRFQPFHKGHYATYEHLVKKFGKNNVFIGTSDKTDNQKSPFNFKEKKTIMTKMFGISPNKIVLVKNPYAPMEILKNYDETTTAFITVVGEKDEARLGGKYFTPYKGNLEAGYKDKGYVYVSPAQPNAISGTDVRNWLGKDEIEDRKKLFNKAYPKFDEKIFNLITTKLSSLNESSSIDSGEPETGYSADGIRRIINKGKPENWFIQGGYKQLDKPKVDNMRGKGKGKDTESQFRKVTFQLKGVTQPDEKNKRVPYQVDKWKNVTARTLKKKEGRYWDLNKVNEGIFIPKEFIEEWVSENLNRILSEVSTSTTGPATNIGKNVDDGPNFFFPNYDTFDAISKERAEMIGYTVFKQIMSGELEDYYEHPIYPNGPVKAVTPFPAGVIGKTTAVNQKDLFGDDAYDKWYKHVTRSMALVGYELVKDFDKLSKDLAIQSADNIKKVAGIEKIKDTVMESGMGLAMGYPSKEQLLQKKKERDELRKKMDKESEYYQTVEEDITIPLNVGDTVLGGKFKNKKIVVKDISKNEKGEVTVNGKPLLKYRLIDEAYDEVIAELMKTPQFEGLLSEIPMADLQQLDKFADKQLDPIDVVLTGRHFLERLVDPRNKKPISAAELTGFFKRLARKKNEFVEFLKKYGEIVAKDNRTKINIPFMQQANKAIAKTIMRKDDFKTPSPELKFEKLKETSGIDGLGGGNNSARWTATGQSKKLKIPQLSGYEQTDFPIADELDTSNEKHSWDGIGKTKKYNNKVRAIRKDDGSLIFEDNITKGLVIKLTEDTIKYLSKSLGMSRKDMPQISSKHIGDFVKYLNNKGVSVSPSVIDVSKIGMTQKDINVDKVKDLLGVEKSNLSKPVIISNDGYILDGHHRVVALYNVDKNFKLKTIKVDLGIKDLLKAAGDFPKVSYKGIEEFYGNYDTRHVRPAAPMKGLGESDDNWKDVNEGLITEGGAYGHMNHPFDIDINLTFGQLKDIVKKALKGELELTREKTDGQALAISWVNGRLVAARNKSHLKDRGKGAMDINAVATKFANRGGLTDAYNFAMKDLSVAISKLSDAQKEKVFGNGSKFMNLEVIYPESVNVIPYGQALLVFHGTFEYDEAGNIIGEDQSAGKILAGMIKQINQNVQSKYTIQGPPVTKLPKNKELSKLQPKYLGMISKLQSEFGLKDNQGVGEYHQKWWEAFIEKNAPTLDAQQKIGLVKRWAFMDKGFRLKDIQDEKILKWAEGIDKGDQQKISKENLMKFEKIFLGIGAEVLSFMISVLTVNPDKAKRAMIDKLEKTIKDVEASGDAVKIEKLRLELQRMEDIGGFDKIVPAEGIVFSYGGYTMKLTGAFASLNQINGIFFR
jgi:putative sterol carrier protein